MKLKKSEIWPVAGKAFPDYKGRKFYVEVSETVTFYDTNWGGGTRNRYKSVQLSANGTANSLPVGAPWANAVEGKTVDIPAGWVVVKHAYFCGYDVGLTVYANPQDMPKLLPEDNGRQS